MGSFFNSKASTRNVLGIVLLSLALLEMPDSAMAQNTHLRRKRAAGEPWKPKDDQAFAVNVLFDTSNRYVVKVGMGGDNASAGWFKFLLSTNSPLTAVAGANCGACLGQATYNPANSPTVQTLDSTAQVSLGGGSLSGQVVRESCALKQANGTDWWYKNQTVVVANSTEGGLLRDGASGVIGFGRRIDGSVSEDTLISNIFNNHPGWSNLTIGIALEQPQSGADSGSGGVVTFRELDDSLYEGDISWSEISSLPEDDDVPAGMPVGWNLSFKYFQTNIGGRKVVSDGGIATIETSYPDIRLPQSDVLSIYEGVPNAQMTNDTTNGLSWLLPCDTDLSFEITIQGTTYRVKREQLMAVADGRGKCYSLIRGWSEPAVKIYMLGAPFAQSAFIAYLAQRDGNDQIGVAARSNAESVRQVSSGVPTGTLVAAIVGSVCGTLAIIAGVVFFLWYKRRIEVPRSSSPREKSGLDPYNMQPNSATPILQPMGSPSQTRRWVIEQGPIGGEVLGTDDRGNLLVYVTPDASPTAFDTSTNTRSGLGAPIPPQPTKAPAGQAPARRLFAVRGSRASTTSESSRSSHSFGPRMDVFTPVTVPMTLRSSAVLPTTPTSALGSFSISQPRRQSQAGTNLGSEITEESAPPQYTETETPVHPSSESNIISPLSPTALNRNGSVASTNTPISPRGYAM